MVHPISLHWGQSLQHPTGPDPAPVAPLHPQIPILTPQQGARPNPRGVGGGGPAGSAPGLRSCSTSGEGGSAAGPDAHQEGGGQCRAPRSPPAGTRTPGQKQEWGPPKYCKTYTNRAPTGLLGGGADRVPPPPASSQDPTPVGKAKGKLRHSSAGCHQPQGTLQPCPVPKRGDTGQAPPPSSFPQHRAAGMAPEPARGRGPTHRHPVAELVPLGPTAVGAAPAGDSARGRPCPGLHRPPGPGRGGSGDGGGALPRPDPREPPRRRVPRGTHAGTARERARAPIHSGAGRGEGGGEGGGGGLAASPRHPASVRGN
ncbi:translation initiation factor IF-2-like [Tyto alba]|uniref:translation initiation factor IF-2-like n=1 Tax=Tyto alba TaxID=56313 RepID=UPI001C685F52|nr:translation initiation factor IF-2-like [Tyto alba]